jgi:hypothetical protein
VQNDIAPGFCFLNNVFSKTRNCSSFNGTVGRKFNAEIKARGHDRHISLNIGIELQKQTVIIFQF